MFATSTSTTIYNSREHQQEIDNRIHLPRDLDRRFRSREVDRRRSSIPPRLPPGGPPRRVEPRPPPEIKSILSIG